ncbi:hypothetical protein UlMin_025886 [Ulmus minor]
MDEFFGGMDGRFRVSITDSTMMRIVHCAMNKAHEKVKSKEGVIERLNGISKFYELAVMQLEGCIKFVQEEQDSYILESSHEEVLAGLTEIRNRLQGRLKESEMAIRDKDRELTERLECELKLRQALELKEKELVSLRAKLKLNKLEKTKSEGAEDRDGGFCELKNSVDQQVWNIRQKLEPDYNKLRDKERDHEGVDNQKVEQMDSDIDILKETLDLAFGKMQNAIILSEFAPVEQQYRWSIEKDTISILLKGFMWDFEKKLEAKKWKQARKVSIGGFDEVWSGLINEVAGLRDELKLLVSQNEVQVKSVESLQSNIGSKISNKGVEEANEVSDEDRDNFVAKMIKNHESIIRKKSEEAEVLNLLRREILREKGYSSCKKGKEQVSLKMKVQEVIAKLDSLIDWDAKIGESFDDHRDMQEEETSDGKDKVRANIDTLEDAWENIDKVFSAETKELYNKIRMLEQELEESNFQKKIVEETYLALSEGLQRDIVIHFSNHDLERMISENLFKDLVVDTVNQWNQKVESNNVEAEIREEVLCIVFNEAIKDFSLICDSNSAECDGLRAENSSLKESAFADKLDNLEGAMREDILIVIFDEMCKESSKRVNEYNDEVLVTEEICCFVFDETIKSIVDTACSELCQTEVLCIAFNEAIKDCGSICDSKSAECDGLRDENNCLKASAFADKLDNLEGAIREDILTVIFDKMYKESSKRENEYNEEVLVRDEICHFVFDETIKSIVNSKSAECDGLRHENSCLKASAFADKLDNLEGAIREDILTVIFDKMYKESSKRENEYNEEVLVRDEICHFVFDETIKSIVNSKSAECDGLRHENSCLKASAFADKLDNLEGAIREDILIVIFNEICKESSKRVDELERLKHQLNPLGEIVFSLRESESLYRKAFIRRCQNLRKAEAEVDLLGDQVEVLIRLLEKVYTKLHQYSPVLQQYFEVSEIIHLIKKELNGVLHKPKC